MKINTTIPPVLWVAIISLAIFSFFHFIIGLSYPLQFVAFGVNIIIIIGLFKLAKWAYFLAIFASLVAPFSLSIDGSIYFAIILLLNLSVLIPVLICTKSFRIKIPGQSVAP
jgi:hypothetical protein